MKFVYSILEIQCNAKKGMTTLTSYVNYMGTENTEEEYSHWIYGHDYK